MNLKSRMLIASECLVSGRADYDTCRWWGAAVSPNGVEQIYKAVCDRLNLMPTGWLGSEIDTWMMLGWVRHQREAELRNQEGIGVYHSVTGWAILPIDYAAMDISPDADRGRRLNS